MSMDVTPVEFYWLATIQRETRQVTHDGVINAVPGMHTRATITKYVLDRLREQYGTGFTILCYSLEPNDLVAGGR